jgi:hypothetical protein
MEPHQVAPTATPPTDWTAKRWKSSSHERMPRPPTPQRLPRRCWTEAQLSSVDAGWNVEQWQREVLCR